MNSFDNSGLEKIAFKVLILLAPSRNASYVGPNVVDPFETVFKSNQVHHVVEWVVWFAVRKRERDEPRN